MAWSPVRRFNAGRFEVDHPGDYATLISNQLRDSTSPLNCHCSQCRRQHGAAFRSRVRVAVPDFHWLKGEELVTYYESERGYQRGFCSRCGSPILNRAGPNWTAPAAFPDGPPQYGIALALLDDPPVKPALHCFVASKAPWFDITDDLPQYPDYPPPG